MRTQLLAFAIVVLLVLGAAVLFAGHMDLPVHSIGGMTLPTPS